MLRLSFLLLYIFFTIHNVNASLSCSAILHNQDTAFDIDDILTNAQKTQLNELYAERDNLLKENNDLNNYSEAKLESQIQEVSLKIRSNGTEFKDVYPLIGDLFYRFEMNFLRIVDLSKKINSGANEGSQKAELETSLREYFKDFSAYTEHRRNLESFLDSEKDYEVRAVRVLLDSLGWNMHALGAANLKSYFVSEFGGRPSFEILGNLYDGVGLTDDVSLAIDKSRITEIKIEEEIRLIRSFEKYDKYRMAASLLRIVRDFVFSIQGQNNGIYGKIINWITKIPKSMVMDLINLEAHLVHLPEIQVIQKTKDETKLEIFQRAMGKFSTHNEQIAFLVTFARSMNYRDTWNLIVEKLHTAQGDQSVRLARQQLEAFESLPGKNATMDRELGKLSSSLITDTSRGLNELSPQGILIGDMRKALGISADMAKLTFFEDVTQYQKKLRNRQIVVYAILTGGLGIATLNFGEDIKDLAIQAKQIFEYLTSYFIQTQN